MNKFHSENNELLPRRSTLKSAGYDFISPETFIVPAHGEALIDSKVSIELDEDKVLMCYVRSSYGFKYGITLSNGTGIIDADFYPNTIKCKLKNNSENDFTVNAGDKYMQGIIMKYYVADDEITPTAIRDSGIGSTGK